MFKVLKNRRVLLVFASLVVLGVAMTGLDGAVAQQKGKADSKKLPRPTNEVEGLNYLSMEVAALQTLFTLEATPAQLREIIQIAKTTNAKPRKQQPGKAGPGYVKRLKELRAALLANDHEKVEALQKQLDKITQANPPQLDADFDITEAACAAAVRLLPKFRPQQIAAYLASYGEDFPDPNQLIVKGLETDGHLKGREWQDARDGIAEEVARLVAGVLRREKVKEKVATFLDNQHGQRRTSAALLRVAQSSTFAQLLSHAAGASP